jgi:hypothetical protein
MLFDQLKNLIDQLYFGVQERLLVLVEAKIRFEKKDFVLFFFFLPHMLLLMQQVMLLK